MGVELLNNRFKHRTVRGTKLKKVWTQWHLEGVEVFLPQIDDTFGVLKTTNILDQATERWEREKTTGKMMKMISMSVSTDVLRGTKSSVRLIGIQHPETGHLLIRSAILYKPKA